MYHLGETEFNQEKQKNIMLRYIGLIAATIGFISLSKEYRASECAAAATSTEGE